MWASYSWKGATLGVTVNNVLNDRSTTAIALGKAIANTNLFSATGTFYQFQSPRTVQGSLKYKF